MAAGRIDERFLVVPEQGGGWEQVAGALGRKMTNLVARGAHCVVVDAIDGREVYAQAMVTEVGTRTEVVANRFLAPDHRLDAVGLAALRALGWQPPDDTHVNHWRADPGSAAATHLAIARLVTVTLADVFCVAPSSPIEVHAFRAVHDRWQWTGGDVVPKS